MQCHFTLFQDHADSREVNNRLAALSVSLLSQITIDFGSMSFAGQEFV
jgi:hypothetical protein